VLKGIGFDLTGPVPANANFYEPDVKKYPYNPETAKKLLAEAGYPNGFSTTLYTYIAGPAVAVSTAIQDQLKKVGIQAELKALEIAAWQEVVKTGTAPLCYMRLTRPPDPHEFLNPWPIPGVSPVEFRTLFQSFCGWFDRGGEKGIRSEEAEGHLFFHPEDDCPRCTQCLDL
jgi:ABC-type transport system substrate-binding protein